MSAMNASINSTSLDAERRSHEPSMEEILASIRRIIADDDALPVIRREREKERRALPPEAPKQAEQLRVAPPVAAPEPRRPAVAAAPEAQRPTVVALAPIVESEPDPAPAEEAQAPVESGDFWLRGSRRGADEIAPVEDDEPGDEQSRWASDAEEELRAPEEDEPTDELRDGDLPETDAETAAPEDGRDDEEAAGLVSTDAANSIASHFQALAASIVISESDLIQRYARELLRPLLKQWLDDNLPPIVEKLVRAEIERVARGRR
jgi:cell pole-organizing protein PopZ